MARLRQVIVVVIAELRGGGVAPWTRQRLSRFSWMVYRLHGVLGFFWNNNKKRKLREALVGFGVRVFEWFGGSVNVLESYLQGIVRNQDCFFAF